MTTQDELQFGPAKYPNAAGFKKEGTSEEAAASITDAKDSHRRILDILKTGDFTADEIAAKMGVTVLYCRPRCSELMKLGRIIETGERRINTISGKRAAVLTRK